MAARPMIALTSLILLAGAILLIFLTLLGGAVDRNPTNQFYFLEAETDAIPGARPLTRWTFWNACGVTPNGRNDCPNARPAYPFDPTRNFRDAGDELPKPFIDNPRRYYLLTRFMFAFCIIGLFFAVLALFLGLLALFSRIGSFLSSAMCSVALFFQILTAALMTAAYVEGRREFRRDGRNARLGRYNFGFMWAAVACLLLSTILFCVGGALSRRSRTTTSNGNSHPVQNPGRIKFFQRRDKTMNRQSYIDSVDQRKEGYP
jgi:hypothetical protein